MTAFNCISVHNELRINSKLWPRFSAISEWIRDLFIVYTAIQRKDKMVHYILQNILKVAYLKPFIHSLLLCQKIHYQFSYPTVAA